MALSPWHPLANSPLRRAITLMAAFTIAMSSLAFVIGSAEALGTPVGGRVMSDSAEPVAGVEVWLFEDDGNGQPGPEDDAVAGPALTREDGTYELVRPDPDVLGWVIVVLDAEVRVTDDVVCLPSAGGLFPGEHPGCVAVILLEPGAVEAAPVVLTVESDNTDAESGDENAEEAIDAAGEGTAEESQDPAEPEVVEAPTADASDLDRESLSQKVLEIPLGFEASLGRTDDHIAFVASSLGYGVDLGADGGARVVVTEEDYFTIDIVGASEPTAVVPSDEQDGVSNYFIGNDPDRWVTDVKRYGEVTFEGIYPGIDVVYHGNGRLLEYDFVVAPGFDPDQITFAIADAKSEITPEGTIRVGLQSGAALIVRAPIAYQETTTGRVDVDVAFGEAGPGAYAFSVGDYDVELPLVIDPVVDWATYLEAVNLARFEEIVVDGAGNVLVAGDSSGGSYPITGGAPDTTSVAQEAIVTKLNPTATAIIWSTYLGGDASDVAETLDIASDGTVYVAGQTWSSNFPMIGGGYDTTFDGGSEAFIVRLNSTGTAILSETFLGGTNTSFSDDKINDLMVDGSDRIYVVGHTRDNDFPTTGGVFQGGYGGGMYDAFVSRLDPTLASLQLSTFAGGSGIDLFETMELTSTGVVFAAGGGGSTDFPITPATAYQTTNPSGQSGKIIAINPTFTSVLYGSYLGGTGTDRLFGSAMVSDTEFIVVGDASSQDVPTRNAYQAGPGDGSSFTDDGIIAKIDISGNGPTSAPFVTYLGGISDDQIYDVDLAPDGSIVFVGVTDSFGLPTTPDAIQASHQGVDDILVGALSSDGSSLNSLSYYGGISSDRAFAVFVDGSGAIYLAGETSSSGLATPGVVDTSQDATSRSGFVAKLLPSEFDVTLLADTGGAGPGEDLVTQADTGNSDPASNEADVGTGTGTIDLRGMDFHPVTEVLYAAGGDTFGSINPVTGVFTAIGTVGSGDGSQGPKTFDSVQGLAFDATTGTLYAVHNDGSSSSYLFAIDPATGAVIQDFYGSDEYVRLPGTATRDLVWAIAIDELGQMFGIQTSSGDGAVRFIRINKATGADTDVSTLDGYILRGMTFTDAGELWVSGKTTGPTVHAMYRINPSTGAIVETVPIDNGADYQSIAAQLALTTTLITGTVFEDVTGDALHDGGYAGDAGDNPPAPGVSVYLYSDTGTAGPDNGDSLAGIVPNPVTTDAAGHYAFYAVPDGTYYVVVDSRTIAPSAGLNGGFGQGDVWAQQTYGGIGTGFKSTPLSWGWSNSARAVYGGKSGYQLAVATSDTFTPATPADAEHVNRVQISGGASVSAVDLGFSFNVVTNLGAPGTEDDDGAANRTVQGSLRQFIQNANAIAGPNAMYFATEPVFTPTDTLVLEEWYSTTITTDLPSITDAGTTIDGALYDSERAGTGGPRAINTSTLGYVGPVGTGPDGVSGNLDDLTIDGVPAPELELNDGPAAANGIHILADDTTVQNIAIWGFGVASDDGNIRIGPHGSNITGIDINNVVLGSGAGVIADPAGSRTLGSNVIAEDATSGVLPSELNSITDSILVYTDASNVSLANEGGWLIQGNEIDGAGIGAANGHYKDAISLGSSPSGHTIVGNWIAGAHGIGVDTWQDPGDHTITDNTITNNGLSVIVEEQAGVRLFGTGNTVQHNIISGNTGAGVIIVGERQPTLPTWSAATGNLISQNEFGANTTISIDLVEASDNDVTHGIGDGVNGNNSDNNELTTGNLGIDSPVIGAAVSSGGSLTVNGTQFDCDTCTVEVYSAVADGDGSDTVGPDDFGEAITYLGSATVSGTAWSLVSSPAVMPSDVTALVIDGSNNTSELAENEPVVLAADFVGRVFHDIVGDQLADDADADLETNDPLNPWLPGVDVYLYEDTGPLIGQPDVADSLFVGPTNPVTTDANGRFEFLGLPAGRTFYVVVDSTTVDPPATTASTDSYWAEQTYGPAGSLVGGAPTGANGPVYGGDDAAVEDTFGGTTLTGAEHIARLTSANPGISDIYFGFSFNVVVNVDANAGGTAIQGSLDQFIQNANKVVGDNAMRFVPGVAVNAPAWWRIDYTATVNPLTSINDAGTDVDGTAYLSTDGTTVTNPNGGFLGANATGLVTVGVDDVGLIQVEKPELEIIADTLRVDINGGLVPDDTRIADLSIWGATTSIDIGAGVIDGIVIEEAVIGSPPDALADPGGSGVWGINADSTASAPAQGGVIQNNLIGFVNQAGVTLETASAEWSITGNEVTDTGNAPSAYDAVLLWGAAAVVTGNYIHDNYAFGVDNFYAGGHLIENNTIENNGLGGVQTGGIRLQSDGSTVRNNVVTGNIGPGIIVAERLADSANSNLITENSFSGNGGLGIDLVISGGNSNTGDGVNPNDAATDPTTGNIGLDHPVFTEVLYDGGTVTIRGTTPATTTLELFEAAADPTGYGEGTLFVPTPWALLEGGPNDTNATAGAFEFSFPAGTLAAGDWLTATATDAANNTSEFGPNRRVLDPPEPPSPVTIDGRVFEDIVGDHLLDGGVGGLNNPVTPGVTVDLFRELPQQKWQETDPSTGQYVAATLTPAGDPVFVYRDALDEKPVAALCEDPKCDTVNDQFTGPGSFDLGAYASITNGSGGYPVIAHYRADTGDLRVKDCNSPNCSVNSDRQIDTAGDVGLYTSIGVPPSSGLPVIAYYDATNGNLKAHRCDNGECSSGPGLITTIDSGGDVGRDTAMAIGADGLPIIAYYDVTNTALKVAHCDDTACSTSTITTVESVNDVGREPSITIGYDGLPKITFYDATNDRIRFARCDDAACTTSTRSNLTLAGAGPVSDIEMGPDGYPWIAYEDSGSVYVRFCYSDSCSPSSSSPVDFGGDLEGQYLDMVIPPATGTAVLGYYDITEDRMVIAAVANDPEASSDQLMAVATNGAGTFTFSGVPAGEYWVSPRSSTVAPAAVTASFDSYHAEQTYGPAGSFCEDGTGSWTGPTAAGACYSGVEGAREDSTVQLLSWREHLALVDGSADATVGDFGFSFNVVTNTFGSVGASSQQGSLDQFIQNANSVAGPNAMRFVPRVAANAFGGGGAWWRVVVPLALADINDAATVIDGHAYNPDGSDRDSNGGTLGSGGSVGVDPIGLMPVDRPELEIQGSRLAIIDSGGQSPDNSAVHRIAITELGNAGLDLISIDGTVPLTGIQVTSSVIGSGPSAFAPPAGAHRWGIGLGRVDGATISGNLIGHGERAVQMTGSTNVLIQGNELADGSKDGVDAYTGASNVTVLENLITGFDDFGIDMLGVNSVIRNNTVDSNGDGTGQTGGVRVYVSPHLIEKNVITNNGGPGVLVSGYDSIVVPDRVQGEQATISNNIFGGNDGLAIDNVARDGGMDAGDGVTALDSDGSTTADHGNIALDHPVVTSAGLVGADVTIEGTKCSGCSVEIYEVVAGIGDTFAGDEYGEGIALVATIPADALTTFSVTVNAAGVGLAGTDEVGAIQFDALGNTSQFGINLPVNEAPVLDALSGGPVAEGSLFTLAATFSDVDPGDTHEARVDWGEGAGFGSWFAVTEPNIGNSHTFADDGSYTVAVEVRDAQGLVDSDSFSLSVTNVAPSVTLSGAVSVAEGSSYSLTVSGVTDPGDDTVSSWVVDWGDGDTDTYGAAPGTVTHTYADGADTPTITIDLVDEDGTYVDVDSLPISVTNVAPTVTLSGAANVDEGSSYSLTVSAVTDPGDDTVSSWVVHWGDTSSDTYATAPGTVTHTYADGDTTPTITIDLVDEDGTYVSVDSLPISVDNVDPTVTLSGAGNVDEGSLYSLTVSAVTDPGDDTVSSWVVHWGDTSSDSYGTAPGTVTHTYADGPNTPTITIDLVDEDGTYTTVDSLGITVDNVAPTVDAGLDQTGAGAGSPVSLDPATFTDPAGTNDTHTATIDWGDGTPVVPGTVDQGLDTVSGSHTYLTSGSYTVRVTVTDSDGDSDFDELLIVVDNEAPSVDAFSGGPIDEGDTFNLAATFSDIDAADTHEARIDWGDGGGFGAWFAVTEPNVADSHLYADDGTFTVVLEVRDDKGGVGSNDFDLTVDNVDPTVTLSGAGNVDEGSSYSLTVSGVTDPGADTVSSWVVHWGDTSSDTYATAPGTVTHTYADGDTTPTITIDLVDEDGTYTTVDSLPISVDNVDPTVTLSGAGNVEEGSSYSLTVSGVADPGADTVTTWVVRWGDTSSDTFGVPPGTITHTYADGPDTPTITIDLVDEDGTYVGVDLLALTVNNVSPTVDAGTDQTGVGIGETVSLDPATFTDPAVANDTHTATIDWGDGSPVEPGTVDDALDTVSGSHSYGAPGVYTVRVTVVDDDGGSGFDELTVTVANTTPVIDPVPDQAGDEGTLFTFTAGATDPDSPETLTFTIEDGVDPVPAGVSMTAGGVFTWTPTEAQGWNDDDGIATYELVVRVTDALGATDSTPVTITVDEVNEPPVVTNPGDQTTDEGVPVSLFVTGSDPDLPGNALSWTATGLPPGLSINPLTGEIHGAIAFTAGPSYVVTVRLTDGDGAFDEESFTWDVTDAGAGLTITKTPDVGDGTPVTPGDSIDYTITVTNNDSVTHTGVEIRDLLPDGTTWSSTTIALPEVDTVADDFDTVAYTNNTGTDLWTGPWTETGDDGTASGGTIRIHDDRPSGFELALDLSGPSRSIEREVDLFGASAVELTFSFNPYHIEHAGEEIYLEVWDGSSWTLLHTFTLVPKSDEDYFPWTEDLTDYAATDTKIRFRTSPGLTVSEGMFVNDLQIRYSHPATPIAGGAGPVLTTGQSLAPGEFIVIHYVVDTDDPPTELTIDNQAETDSDQQTTIVATTSNPTDNRDPVIAPLSGGPVAEASLFTLAASFSDPDSPFDTHEVRVDWGDGAGFGTWFAVTEPNITDTTTYPDNGTYTITVEVRDSRGATDTETFDLSVTNVAPSVSLSGAGNVDEGDPYSLTVSAVSDPGADTVTSWVVHWGDTSSDTYAAAPGTVTHTYADGDTTPTITIDLVDEDGTYTTVDSIGVSVDNVAPSVSLSGAGNVDEGSSYSLTVSAVSDPGADTVTSWVVHWGDTSSDTYATAPGTVTHTYADGDTTPTITIDLVDEDGTYTTVDSLAISVDNVDPTVTLSGAGNVDEGSSYSLTVSGVTDPGDDTVSSWVVHWGDTSSDTYATAPGTATHTYADGATSPTITIDLVDEDGTYTTVDSLGISVDNVDPTVTLSGAANVDEGTAYSLTVSAVTDPGADTVSSWVVHWGDTSSDTYATAPGTVTHTYADGDTTPTITIDLVDEDGTYTTVDSLAISVDNVDPTVTLSGAGNVDEGSSYSLTVSGVTDPGADTVSSWVVHWGDTSSNTYATAPGTVTHTYADGDTTPTITIDLVDEDGTYTTVDSLGISVDNVDPTVTLSGAANVDEGTAYSLTVSAVADPGADTVSSWVVHWGDTSSDTYATAPGTVTHTYADGATSPTITIDLVDEDGTYTTVDSLGISINDVDPDVTLSGAANVDEGSPYSLTVSAVSDPGFDTVSSWIVDWGDGDTDTYAAAPGTVTHTYADGDTTPTITIDLVDEEGTYLDVDSLPIAVDNVVPSVTVTGAGASDEGAAYSLTIAAVVDPGDDIVTSWVVDWGDGDTDAFVAPPGTITHTYTADGTYPVTVDVTDDDGTFVDVGSAHSVVVANVAPVLDPVSDVTADELTLIGFTATAFDAGGDPMLFTLDGEPAGAAMTAGGVFTWTPTEVQGPGVFSFDVVVTDDGGLENRQTVTVSVDEVNVAPSVTSPGDQTTDEDVAVSLPIFATDPDLPVNTLLYAAVGLPDGLTIDSGTGLIAGTVTFDAAGVHPVTVTVTDDGSPNLFDQATFTWTIDNINRAPTADDITLPADAGVPVAITLTGTDPDGDALTFTIGATPTLGVLVPAALPTVTYLPNVDADGTDTFTYTVTDGDLTSAPATVTLGIGANGAPIAAPDTFEIEQNDTLTVPAPGVLGNDLDPDEADLTAVLVTAPAYGTLVLNDDGSFTYVHDGPHGVEDTFTYAAFDGIRTSEPIDVTIDVAPNLSPVAVDDEIEINEDTIASLLPLANDFDPDGDPIAITGYEGVANGTVTVGPNGFVYTPDPNWHGLEVVTYTIQDDRGGTASASITIRVAAGNDAPVAPDINLTMGPGSDPAIVNPLGVASDPDGDSLDFALGSPEHGVLGLAANGRVYTPEAGFNGTDVFTYTVTDPFGARATGTITITVTTPALEDIGLNLVEFGPPDQAGESTDAATDLGLPGMRLLVGSVFDTFDSFRLPFLVLALAFGLSLILGLSGTFILGSGPVFLAAVAPGRVAVVVAASGERIPVHDEPGDKNDVIHYLEPGERNLHATGRRAQVDGEIWTEIETDDGRGWVTASFLTRQVSDMLFGGAAEPEELLKVLNTVLGTSGNLGLVAGDRGLAVAHFAPPETFPTEDLPQLLGSERVWAWWGRSGSIQDEDGTFSEIIAAPLLETMTRYEARNEPAASAPIPIELVNYRSMVYADSTIPGKDAWRVFFELDHDDNWTIAALWREALPNPNAGAGTRRLIST